MRSQDSQVVCSGEFRSSKIMSASKQLKKKKPKRVQRPRRCRGPCFAPARSLFFCLHKLMSGAEWRNAIVPLESESDSATNAGR